MTPDQEALLLTSTVKMATKMDALVSDDLSRGMVPELKHDHDQLKLSTGNQFAYYKGAIAVIAFILLAFGAVFAAHLTGGK